MKKKIKTINVRISLEMHNYLKNHYSWTKDYDETKHKSFSDYIRYLLLLGLDDYY